MSNLEQKSINVARMLSVEAITKANSGHPGLPLGAAPMAFTLWSKFLKGYGKEPLWEDRDRFVLSAGHGSALQYALLHLFGYDLSIEDIKEFRQWNSKTPGHPEFGHTAGIETTTGPLGQGLANAVGMAIAESKLAAEFNTEDFQIVDHYTYVLCGDGDMMEGVASEAASMAGHFKLNKLITFYDSNRITIDGSTDIAFTENVALRFKAYGWNVLEVKDGNDTLAIASAIEEAKNKKNAPTLIVLHTEIGFGCPKVGTSACHGSPLSKDELSCTRESLGANWDEFTVPTDVKNYMEEIVAEKAEKYLAWKALFLAYAKKYPELAAKWENWYSMGMEKNIAEEILTGEYATKDDATRNIGGKVLNALFAKIPNIFGGSADLDGSTKTKLIGSSEVQANSWQGNNIHYGIREHAMGAVMNGISLHGGLRVFGATFLMFCEYMRPAIRLAALMKQPVVYIFTHDSIGVGEDGPTHQPIEQLEGLRTIPNLVVIRPADAKETALAYVQAFSRTDGPTAIILSRQNLPQMELKYEHIHISRDDMDKGAYILVESGKKEKPQVILAGSGSELALCMDVHLQLIVEGIANRVVSVPSLNILANQSSEYQAEIFPEDIPKVFIEAGTSGSWWRYANKKDAIIGIDHFGASAPAEILMEKFGFSKDNVRAVAKKIIK
ncbi:MAG: transketolase [Clostridia bacterium]